MIVFEEYFPALYTQFQTGLLPDVLSILITISFPVLAFILGMLFFPLWVDYIRSKNFLGLKYTVLEVKLPKDIHKSPAAMELFLHSIHNTSDGNNFKQFWLGETRPWYSLELVSFSGNVRFMIWTEDRRKSGVMSSLYAQFPGIEIHEIEDYTKGVFYDGNTMKMWSTEMEFTQPDPFPIKTYIDYGLDKDPKEELKVDPITPVLEYLGSVGPNQTIWIQLIIRAHKKEQRKAGNWFAKTDKWKDDAMEKVNEILLRDPKTKVTGDTEKSEQGQRVTISPGEQEIVKALERSISKLPFDVCVRCMYLAKKESFDTPFGIGGIISSFKHFSSEHLNGFKPAKRWTSKIDSPWQDYKNIRRNRLSRDFLLAYKLRSAFYTPYADSKILVMNTEELATIYHFPGSVALTPTLSRVPSKKSEAPANLPI